MTTWASVDGGERRPTVRRAHAALDRRAHARGHPGGRSARPSQRGAPVHGGRRAGAEQSGRPGRPRPAQRASLPGPEHGPTKSWPRPRTSSSGARSCAPSRDGLGRRARLQQSSRGHSRTRPAPAAESGGSTARQWLQIIERSAADAQRQSGGLQEFTRIRRDQPAVAVDLNQSCGTRSRSRSRPGAWSRPRRGIHIQVVSKLEPDLPTTIGDPPSCARS